MNAMKNHIMLASCLVTIRRLSAVAPSHRVVVPSQRFSPRVAMNSRLLARSFSSSGDDASDDSTDDDEETDEDESRVNSPPVELEPLQLKRYDIDYLKGWEENGRLNLQPFYQRGYKWSQKQASLWMESILIGYPCMPHVMLLKSTDEDGEDTYSVFDGQQRLTSTMLYMKNQRGLHWPNRKNDNNFLLDSLPKLKHYEGKVSYGLLSFECSTSDSCQVVGYFILIHSAIRILQHENRIRFVAMRWNLRSFQRAGRWKGKSLIKAFVIMKYPYLV